MHGDEPFPGCMSICLDCAYREGVRCTCPEAQVNGGPGMRYAWKDGAQPMRAHVCRSPRRLSGFVTMYPGRVVSCSGKLNPVPETPAP